ncbi:MAG: hypothetical protein EXR12_01415 [Rhodospirillaceae bacterium]|nr:hypothetical protein [Rhodospirillaceae bacterium]
MPFKLIERVGPTVPVALRDSIGFWRHRRLCNGVQSKTEQSTTDSQIWISNSTGLPLRQHIEMSGAARSRHEARFDYTNVCTPMGVAQ